YAGGAGINANLVLHAAGNDCVFDIKFHVGTVGSFTVAGTSCPSTVGLATLSSPNPPAINQTMQVDVSNTSPAGIPVMVLGLSALTSPVPVMVFLSADPSCELQVSPDMLLTLPIGSSTSWQLAIPNAVNLLNFSLFLQCAQLEAGGTCVTEYAEAVIGN